MLLNKTFALIIAFSLLFPSRIFPANTLAPAGILETGQDGRMVDHNEDKNIDKETEKILRQLRHGSAFVRIAGAKSSMEFVDAKILNAIINALVNENEKDARKAEAEALLTIGPKLYDSNLMLAVEVISAVIHKTVINKMEDREYQIYRIRAGNALCNLLVLDTWGRGLEDIEKAHIAYTAVFAALQVGDTAIGSNVGIALFFIGAKMYKEEDYQKAQNSFNKVLDLGTPDLKKQALIYLGKIAYPQKATIEKLIDALEDNDIAEQAEEALNNVGNEKNIGIIMNALEKAKVRNVRERLARILLYIGRNNFDQLNIDNFPKIDQVFIYALTYGDKETLLNVLKIIPNVRSAISYGIYNALRNALKDKDKQIRIEAINVLSTYENPECEEALIYALNNRRLRIGIYAAEALEKYPGKNAINALASAVTNRFLPVNVRIAAAKALGNKVYLNEKGLRALVKGLQSRRMPLAEASALALGRNKTIFDSEAADINALKDFRFNSLISLFVLKKGEKYKKLRESIVITLNKLGDKRAVKVLSHGLLYDKDPLIRQFCAVALSNFSDIRIIQVLIKGLEDKDPKVRDVCAKALGKIGSSDDTVIKALEKLSKDRDETIRKSAEQALKEIAQKTKPHDKIKAATILFLVKKSF